MDRHIVVGKLLQLSIIKLPPPQLSYNLSYKAYAKKKWIEVFKDTYLFSTKALKSLRPNCSYKKIFTGKTHKNFDGYREFPSKGNCIDDVIQLIADFVMKETTFNNIQEQSCIGFLKNRLSDFGPIHATPPSFALYMMGIIITKRKEG